MLRRNGPIMKSVESVLRLEGSLWGEKALRSPSATAELLVRFNNASKTFGRWLSWTICESF